MEKLCGDVDVVEVIMLLKDQMSCGFGQNNEGEVAKND